MISGSITSFSSISLTLGAMTSWAYRLTVGQSGYAAVDKIDSPVSRSISSSSVKFHSETGVSISGRVISWTPLTTLETWSERRDGTAIGRATRSDRKAGRNMV